MEIKSIIGMRMKTNAVKPYIGIGAVVIILGGLVFLLIRNRRK